MSCPDPAGFPVVLRGLLRGLTGALLSELEQKRPAPVRRLPGAAMDPQLLNDARVVPVKKDGNPYFMFQFIKKESIYEKLGLKKNDIILEINGFIVDSVAKALKLLEVLQSEREISLKVERDGESVNFRYYIN